MQADWLGIQWHGYCILHKDSCLILCGQVGAVSPKANIVTTGGKYMYYKSAAVMHYSGGYTFKSLTGIVHRYAKHIDNFITATIETGIIAIIIGIIGGFILMLHASNFAYLAYDVAVSQWIPMLFESCSKCL